MAMFRLNTYLTKRGFKNITPNFGTGKPNADWVLRSKNLIVQRRLLNGLIKITLYQNGTVIGKYTTEEKAEFMAKLDQILA